MSTGLEAYARRIQAGLAADMIESKAHSRLDEPGFSTDGATATLTTAPGESLADIPALLRARGINPDDWTIDRVTVNEWESGGLVEGLWVKTILHQLKVALVAKIVPKLLVPARLAKAPKTAHRPIVPSEGSRLAVIMTDSQIPFHDERLHELSLRFLEAVRPDEVIDLGDFLDLPSLSKYREKPEFHAEVQQSLNVGGRVLQERRDASPNARRRMLRGNHDTRLRNFILDHARPLFKVTRAQIGFEDDTLSVLDLEYLLRMDELGWEMAHSAHGEYPYETIEIAPGLQGVHGEFVRQGAGNSVRQEIARRDHSIMQGHVNKQALFSVTRTGIRGPVTLWGCEAGLMCRRGGSLGFGGNSADWALGFCTVTTFPDASWQIELVPCINGAITWRGMRFWHADNGAIRVA